MFGYYKLQIHDILKHLNMLMVYYLYKKKRVNG